MADASSNGSSGSSGYHDGRRRMHHRSSEDANGSSSNSEACASFDKLPSDLESLERAFESYEDRVIAKKAVEIVLNATRKRPGFKGAVSICTEVTSLLQKNRRLEQIINLQNKEILRCRARSKKNGSLTGGYTETKAIQVKPVLVSRTTSPFLKEVYVRNSSQQAAQADQTEISPTDANRTPVKDVSDKGCPSVEERDEVQIHNKMTKAEENWLKVQEENIHLKNELITLRNEIESLKKKEATVFPTISEGQPTASQTVTSLAKQLEQQSKGKTSLPGPSTQREAEDLSHENELPHIPQARNHGQAVDNKPRVSCHPHQRRKGFRPFSSPYKVSPNPQSHLQPIRPIDMYSQCKCRGCVQAVSEEKEVLCGQHATDIGKKHRKRPEILPCIGDHVVVRSHLTGVVRYIGPVGGKKQSYVGLHLDSPVGNNNGSVDGVQYFSCPPSYGALVPVDEILCVTASNVVKEKHNTGANPACHRSSSSPTLQAPKTARTLYKESHSDKRVKT